MCTRHVLHVLFVALLSLSVRGGAEPEGMCPTAPVLPWSMRLRPWYTACALQHVCDLTRSQECRCGLRDNRPAFERIFGCWGPSARITSQPASCPATIGSPPGSFALPVSPSRSRVCAVASALHPPLGAVPAHGMPLGKQHAAQRLGSPQDLPSGAELQRQVAEFIRQATADVRLSTAARPVEAGAEWPQNEPRNEAHGGRRAGAGFAARIVPDIGVDSRLRTSPAVGKGSIGDVPTRGQNVRLLGAVEGQIRVSGVPGYTLNLTQAYMFAQLESTVYCEVRSLLATLRLVASTLWTSLRAGNIYMRTDEGVSVLSVVAM